LKKTLTYFATAVLLGFAVMMLPLALQTGPPTYQPTPQFMNTPAEDNATKGAGDSEMRSYGLGPPSSLLPSSLIFFAGLIISLTAYVVVKRRTR